MSGTTHRRPVLHVTTSQLDLCTAHSRHQRVPRGSVYSAEGRGRDDRLDLRREVEFGDGCGRARWGLRGRSWRGRRRHRRRSIDRSSRGRWTRCGIRMCGGRSGRRRIGWRPRMDQLEQGIIKAIIGFSLRFRCDKELTHAPMPTSGVKVPL